MPREKTDDEIRDEFLNHIHTMIDYWLGINEKDLRGKMEGLAFSILVAIDGEAAALPPFALIPLPHPDDKQYCIDNDEDYYPFTDEKELKHDIGGALHEKFYK